jgi:hypothetical protein
MKLDIYLNYPGNCKEALQFYEQHLGGKMTMMMPHGAQPGNPNIPADWERRYSSCKDGTGWCSAYGSRYSKCRTDAKCLSYSTTEQRRGSGKSICTAGRWRTDLYEDGTNILRLAVCNVAG